MDQSQSSPVPSRTNGTRKATLIAAIGIMILMVVYTLFSKKLPEPSGGEENGNMPLPINEPPTPSLGDSTSSVSQSPYVNGTYHAIGDYQSPGGAEQIDVTLTLQDGVILDATVKSLASRPISQKMQGQFVSGYTTFVIGKTIDEVNLDKVSGSSLTPKGFNEALEEIKARAAKS